MVAIINNEFFEKSKTFFDNRELDNSLDYYEKALSYIDLQKDKFNYIQFLKEILKYCKENDLLEQEALALRALGRTYSVFKQYVESLNYHKESLKIQRKLGRKKELAEGLLFLAEDLEICGNYDECIEAFLGAEEIFHELGKLSEAKEIKKEISRIKEFSKEMVEDEYILQKFHVDKY